MVTTETSEDAASNRTTEGGSEEKEGRSMKSAKKEQQQQREAQAQLRIHATSKLEEEEMKGSRASSDGETDAGFKQ